jgi:hypothetical protein
MFDRAFEEPMGKFALFVADFVLFQNIVGELRNLFVSQIVRI